MEINGLPLPSEFVRMLDQGSYVRDDALRSRDSVDAYGHPLEIALAELYVDRASLVRATVRVAIGFEADGWYGSRSPIEPGSLPDIVDFTRIVCFGSSPEGEPFCFDYRERGPEPSVICWDGELTIWRRIAPDFVSFGRVFGLFLGNDDLDRPRP